MRRLGLIPVLCCALLPVAAGIAGAQTIPANVPSGPGFGFRLPRLGGNLNYSFGASELISKGFYSNSSAEYTTDFSGDLAYLSTSDTHPFSAIYAGGVLLANSGQPTTTYQNLSLSQGFTTRKWTFNLDDGVTYLPESPATGLSGIPGAGDLGIDPLPIGPESGIGILTTYGPRVSNTASASVSRLITPHISAQGNGYYSIQRFIGDNSGDALNNSSEGGSGGVSYHFDARSAVTVNYNYTTFTYQNSPVSFSSQGGTVEYSRRWSRRLSTDAYIGPQHISATGPGVGPASNEIAAGAGVSLAGRVVFYSLNYSRGTNNGSGVIPGSFSDNVVAAAHRQFGRVWDVSGSVSYSRTTSLPQLQYFTYSGHGFAGSGQVSRALGRVMSGYASYTVEEQTSSGNAAALNAFSGTYQIFAIGVSYSPKAISLRR